eukprot:349906-Chlamydomonas_euryale.AAC.7
MPGDEGPHALCNLLLPLLRRTGAWWGRAGGCPPCPPAPLPAPRVLRAALAAYLWLLALFHTGMPNWVYVPSAAAASFCWTVGNVYSASNFWPMVEHVPHWPVRVWQRLENGHDVCC